MFAIVLLFAAGFQALLVLPSLGVLGWREARGHGEHSGVALLATALLALCPLAALVVWWGPLVALEAGWMIAARRAPRRLLAGAFLVPVCFVSFVVLGVVMFTAAALITLWSGGLVGGLAGSLLGAVLAYQAARDLSASGPTARVIAKRRRRERKRRRDTRHMHGLVAAPNGPRVPVER